MWYSSFWSEGPRNHLNWQNLVQYFVPCCVDLRGISGAASPDPWRQNLGKRKVKGSKKAIFAVIWGGFEGFGTCLGISHPTHPHLGKISPKKLSFLLLPFNTHFCRKMLRVAFTRFFWPNSPRCQDKGGGGGGQPNFWNVIFDIHEPPSFQNIANILSGGWLCLWDNSKREKGLSVAGRKRSNLKENDKLCFAGSGSLLFLLLLPLTHPLHGAALRRAVGPLVTNLPPQPFPPWSL